MALRCLIVDDNPDFLRSASALLEAGALRVVGMAATAEEAVRRVSALSPDVTIVDVEVEGESGFDLVQRLSSDAGLRPGHLILVSVHAKADLADLIEASPAIGFLAKSTLFTIAIEQLLREAER